MRKLPSQSTPVRFHSLLSPGLIYLNLKCQPVNQLSQDTIASDKHHLIGQLCHDSYSPCTGVGLQHL